MENMKPVYKYVVSGAVICKDPDVAGAIPPFFCKTEEYARDYLMSNFESLLAFDDVNWKMMVGGGTGVVTYINKETNELVGTIDTHNGYAELERPELEECDYERWEYIITRTFMGYEPVQEEENE